MATGFSATFWLNLITFVYLVLLNVYIFANNRHRATQSQLVELEKEMDKRMDKLSAEDHRIENQCHALAKSMEGLKTKVNVMPDHDDLKQIYERIEHVNQSMRGTERALHELKGTIEPVQSSLKLITEYLMQQNKGGN